MVRRLKPPSKPKRKTGGGMKLRGSTHKTGSIRTAADIRKAARESGMMPMEMLLEASRTGKLPKFLSNGYEDDSTELSVDTQLECIKACLPYYHPKVNPVNDVDEGPTGSGFIAMFRKDRVALLSTDQLQYFEHMITTLMGDVGEGSTIDQKKLFADMAKKLDDSTANDDDHSPSEDHSPDELSYEKLITLGEEQYSEVSAKPKKRKKKRRKKA